MSDIDITKTWLTASPVGTGDTVTVEIVVTNNGAGPVSDIVVTDVFDPGLTYVSDTGGCALSNQRSFRKVECTIAGPIAGGGGFTTFTIDFVANYWGYRTYTRNYRTEERLEIQKEETHVNIQTGVTSFHTVNCDAGYDILDYSWHVQNVDQDTGDFYDVYLMSSDIDDDSATVELFNDSAGNAQGKLWALCLKDDTNWNNPVGWDPQSDETRVEPPVGNGGHPVSERPFYAECPQGKTPMAMNISATDAPGTDPDSIYQDDLIVQTGLEADGGRRATIWAIVKDHATITVKWRCLNTKIGVNRLWFENVEDSVADVPEHDRTGKTSVTCDHHYKGVVGGWRGGKFNGSEPRPKTRVYWHWHDYTAPATVPFEASLLCLHNRLRRGGKVDKSGAVTDVLDNWAGGTSGLGTAWIPGAVPAAPLVVEQDS